MAQRLAGSDALLASLCREISWLRERACRARADLAQTRHAVLCQRLQRELEAIAARRNALLELCKALRSQAVWQGSLGLALLEELCLRCSASG